MSLTVTVQVFRAAAWRDVSTDTLSRELAISYGITGMQPQDVVADTGTLQCVVRNDDGDGRTEGAYSPGHSNALTGWGWIPIRVLMSDGTTTRTKFRGKIRDIRPEPGQTRGHRNVGIVAYDVMRDLAESVAREVELQVNKTESELLDVLVSAMPADAQPVATDFDAGVDTYPYSFADLGDGTTVIGVAQDIVLSAFGMLFSKGDGTLVYVNRHTLALESSAFTIDDTEMQNFDAPSNLDNWFNRARVTNHPLTVSDVADETLYDLPEDAIFDIPPGATREVWTPYSDPNDRNTPVGGHDVIGGTGQPALTPGVHYAGAAMSDGSGADLTGNLSVSIDPFASTAKWTLENTGGVPVFVHALKVVGRAVRDPGPQTFEAYISSPHGDRPIDIDLPYQDDATTAQSVADYVVGQYSAIVQPSHVEFLATENDDLLEQALLREPGDRITVSEEMTGVASVEAIIRSVSLRYVDTHLWCRWGLMVPPLSGISAWELEVVGKSELGVTTELGF